MKPMSMNSSLRRGLRCGVALFLTGLSSGSALAREGDRIDPPSGDEIAAGVTLLPMTETKVISDGEGRNRVLLQPADLSFAFGEAIISATLEIPLAGAPVDRELRLRVYPLDRDWSASDATWTSPWTEPGGDVYRDDSVTIEIPRGSTESVLQIDVSSLVRAMADGDVGMNGFLVTLPDPFGDGLDGADAERLASAANAKLYVDVRRISALGLAREGTRAFFPQIAKRVVKQPAGEAALE